MNSYRNSCSNTAFLFSIIQKARHILFSFNYYGINIFNNWHILNNFWKVFLIFLKYSNLFNLIITFN